MFKVTNEIGPTLLRFYVTLVAVVGFYCLSVNGFVFELWMEVELLLVIKVEDFMLELDLTLDLIKQELSRFYLLLEFKVTLNFTLLANPRYIFA